jgi:cytochrome c-type biogenesis protein CcmH/NrfG
MQNRQGAPSDIDALEALAMRAAQTGQEKEAIRLWGRILAIDPNHARTLTALGQVAFRQADMQTARTAFQRIADLDGSDAQQWIHLALACRGLNDQQAEESAIQRPLSLDPTDLAALILRADLIGAAGKDARGRRRPQPGRGRLAAA